MKSKSNMKEKKNIPQNSGFKTPDSYFEGFKVDFSQIENSSVFNQIENSGFKTPTHYFKSFNIDLPKEEKTSKVIQLHTKQIITAIASIAAVFIFIVLIYKNPVQPFSTEEISSLAIEDYLEQNEFDFENELNFNTNIQAQLNTVDNEAILDYLSNNSDITSLLNDE